MQRVNESGRSMVEMLGVLAVIGVLSVGGIAGYTIAMNNHRANETISDAMKMAVLVSSQRQLGQSGNINGFQGGSPYALTLSGAEGNTKDFTLTAANVPDAVRQRIQNLKFQTAKVEVEGDNIKFTFNNDLSDKVNSEGEDIVDCASFTPTACQTSCENGKIINAEIGTDCNSGGLPALCDGRGNCVELESRSGCFPSQLLCDRSLNHTCGWDIDACRSACPTDGGCENVKTEEVCLKCNFEDSTNCLWNGTSCYESH